MISCRFICLYSLLLLCSCYESKKKQEYEYLKPIASISVIEYKKDIESVFNNRVDLLAMSGAIMNYKNKEWFCVLGQKNDYLFLFNTQDVRQTDSIKINIPDSTIRRSVFLISNQLLIVHEPFRSEYSVYSLDRDSLVLTSKIDLPAFAWKKYYIDYGTRVCLQGNGAPLVYGYGTKEENKKYEYLDPEHNLVIFTTGDSSYRKLGRYPADFFNHKIYNNGSLLSADSNNNIYYTFQMHDSIYKINKEGQIIAAAVLHNNPDFEQFNWKKYMDLGYVRRHTLMSEMNLNICATPNKDIVVIKQLRKKEYRDKSYYKYFVLDSNLKMKYADTLRHGFTPGFLFQYKNGFMVFGEGGNKAVYYETG